MEILIDSTARTVIASGQAVKKQQTVIRNQFKYGGNVCIKVWYNHVKIVFSYILRDYLFANKLSTDNKSADDVLLGLGGEKVAVSVNVANFAAGLSDKLENGDIVSVIIYDKDMYTSYIPAELKYVKVITTTTNEGVDKDEIVEGGKAATVTVLVTPEQAELLAHYNSVTTIHFTLVYRGETDKADAYIKVQDDYLKNNPIDNTPKETEEENNG